MKSGFSLVELSIVLVILGLLTGGILAGQTLIRASELRAVTSEYQNYQTAVMTFRDKYFAMPGDMRNAEDFWGQQASGTACATTASTGPATCNGDGDGLLEHEGGYTGSSEQFRFWQHLANAGLIEGSYNGILGSTGNIDHVVFGTNTPRSKLGNAGWSARSWSSVTFMTNKQALNFGAATTNSVNNAGALAAEEAWNIETKVDDGLPPTGKVRSLADSAGCVTNTTVTAEYNVQATGLACSLAFIVIE